MQAARGVEQAEAGGLRRSCTVISAIVLAISGVNATTGRHSKPCCSSAKCRLQVWDLLRGGAMEGHSRFHKLGGSREGDRSLQPRAALELHQYIIILRINMLSRDGSYLLHHHLLRVR
jgi:hypothetical protein